MNRGKKTQSRTRRSKAEMTQNTFDFSSPLFQDSNSKQNHQTNIFPKEEENCEENIEDGGYLENSENNFVKEDVLEEKYENNHDDDILEEEEQDEDLEDQEEEEEQNKNNN